MEQSRSWEANRFYASQEGSMRRLQQPAICRYPEPDQASPCPYIPLPEDPA
jgi:hypothetical protein